MNYGPIQQANSPANFEDFTDILTRLLNAAWGEDWGTFCEAFPNGREPNSVKMPVITYTLEEMVPGVISNDGRREIKARHRYSDIQGPDAVGPRAIEIYGRLLDCKVIFEVWEENNTKATNLATKFMEFLDIYLGYIKSCGIKEVIFRRYSNGEENGAWRDDIVCRSLTYDVRLEHLFEVARDVITKVTGSITTGDATDSSIHETMNFKANE